MNYTIENYWLLRSNKDFLHYFECNNLNVKEVQLRRVKHENAEKLLRLLLLKQKTHCILTHKIGVVPYKGHTKAHNASVLPISKHGIDGIYSINKFLNWRIWKKNSELNKQILLPYAAEERFLTLLCVML